MNFSLDGAGQALVLLDEPLGELDRHGRLGLALLCPLAEEGYGIPGAIEGVGATGPDILLGLLAPHGDVLAARDALGFRRAAGDGDGDRDFDVRMQRQRHLVLADRLDRRVEMGDLN